MFSIIPEYENPLFTLGKRRRNTSATEDKKPAITSPTTAFKAEASTSQEDDHHKDRKKLKKHRKGKSKRHSSEDDPTDYVKKKKKKHKCCEDHCKHRKHHKKHRKHRKRHHSSSKETSSSDEQKVTTTDYPDNKSDGSGDSERLSTLIAVEKSPEEKMKTVIKKAVLSKKCLVKTAVLDFNTLSQYTKPEESKEEKDNLKDSGICLEDEAGPSTSDGAKKVIIFLVTSLISLSLFLYSYIYFSTLASLFKCPPHFISHCHTHQHPIHISMYVLIYWYC